jgi:hypothetical protein
MRINPPAAHDIHLLQVQKESAAFGATSSVD